MKRERGWERDLYIPRRGEERAHNSRRQVDDCQQRQQQQQQQQQVHLNTREMVKAIYIMMVIMAAGSAVCTPPPPKAFVKSGSFAQNKGFATALSANSEQAFGTPSYDGSHSMSGSYVTTEKDSEGYTSAYGKASTDDPTEHTEAESSSAALMTNYHYVPNSKTSTKFFSVADGYKPYAGSAARDVVLNAPHSAGAYSQAGASGADSLKSLENYGNFQGYVVNERFPDPFPVTLITGNPLGEISLGRKLLSAPPPYRAFALTSGGSNGTAHGHESIALGGNAAASFDSPHAQGSISDSLDYATSGPVMGEAGAKSKVFTASSFTGASSDANAYMNTKWYEPSGQASANLDAMASGKGGWDVAEGSDFSIVTPHWAGATSNSLGSSSYSELGLAKAIGEASSFLPFPFATTWVPELRGSG